MIRSLINGKISDWQYDLLIGALEYTLNKLLLDPDVNVLVVIEAIGLYDGFVEYNENHNIYELHVHSRLNIRDRIKTVIHECIHIKQMESFELLYADDYILWWGEEYKYDEEYTTLPWEVEASTLEELMFQDWVTDNNLVYKFTKG